MAKVELAPEQRIDQAQLEVVVTAVMEGVLRTAMAVAMAVAMEEVLETELTPSQAQRRLAILMVQERPTIQLVHLPRHQFQPSRELLPPTQLALVSPFLAWPLLSLCKDARARNLSRFISIVI